MKDKWLERFKAEILPVLAEEFNPLQVILFGSRTRGNARESSDIDVILVSDGFEQIPFLKRMPFILNRISFPRHIDFICYTPDEFRRIGPSSSLLAEALETGEVLHV